MRPSTFFFAAGLLVLSHSAVAATVVDGMLGQWLAREAGPAFVELFANHPRLRDQPVKIMAMQNGHPRPVGNRLAEEVREQLTFALVRASSAKVVYDDRGQCTPRHVSNVLGVEIESDSGGQHRVTLAVVDLDEGIWVNGTSRIWRGRLTSEQRRALSAAPAPMSVAGVYELSRVKEIAEALDQQLRCQPGLPAPVYVAAGAAAPAPEIARLLRESLGQRTLVTMSRESAATVLSLALPRVEGDSSDGDTSTVSVHVVEAGGGSVRMAEVAIAGKLPTNLAHRSTPALVAPMSPRLMSEIRLAKVSSRDSRCDRHDDNCVDVELELFEPAYLLLFYTARGQLRPVSCEPPSRRQDGRQHLGLNVPTGNEDRAALGFYAIAIPEHETAIAIHRAMKGGSSMCGAGRPAEALASVRELLASDRQRVSWRSIHLRQVGDRVVQAGVGS